MGGAGKKMYKVLESDDVGEITTASFSFKMALMKARQAKGLTQKALAQKIQEKPAVIQQLEQGKSKPNNNLMRKLERALGTKLPRDKKQKKKSNKQRK